MIWYDCKLSNPKPYAEVLVWIDNKRGAMWKNNHALVAYITPNGEWFEERHPSREPLAGVIAWAPILDPDVMPTPKTLSQKMREAGFTRRPSAKSLPSDE